MANGILNMVELQPTKITDDLMVLTVLVVLESDVMMVLAGLHV